MFIPISFIISHLVPNSNSECVKYVDLTRKFSLFKKGTWFKNIKYCVRFKNFLTLNMIIHRYNVLFYYYYFFFVILFHLAFIFLVIFVL